MLRLEGGILGDHLPEGGFDRHISACNNARLPGERLPFRIGSDQVGWVTPVIVKGLGRASAVNRDSDGVTLKVPEALPAVARALADQGLFRWRGEEFDVRASPEGPSLARIDRGAIPSFGIQAQQAGGTLSVTNPRMHGKITTTSNLSSNNFHVVVQ